MTVTEFASRFVSRATVTERGCWLPGWRKPGKRMYVRRGGGERIALHRLAYETYVGPVPPGLEACHTCDVSECFNPWHVWPGTHAENMADMRSKNRARGLVLNPGVAGRVGGARLTPRKLRACRVNASAAGKVRGATGRRDARGMYV